MKFSTLSRYLPSLQYSSFSLPQDSENLSDSEILGLFEKLYGVRIHDRWEQLEVEGPGSPALAFYLSRFLYKSFGPEPNWHADGSFHFELHGKFNYNQQDYPDDFDLPAPTAGTERWYLEIVSENEVLITPSCSVGLIESDRTASAYYLPTRRSLDYSNNPDGYGAIADFAAVMLNHPCGLYVWIDEPRGHLAWCCDLPVEMVDKYLADFETKAALLV